MGEALDRLRVDSDTISNRDEDMVNKGARQCLVRLLEITDRDEVIKMKDKMEGKDT